MSVENPTGSDSGASITDRLESYLAAGDSPDERKPTEQADTSDTGDDQAPDANAESNPVDPSASDEQGDDDGPQLSTADLARVFGIDESMLDVGEDGNAVIKTKIDGKDGAAKFADILKSYQLHGHADNRAREVAEQQRAIQQKAAEADQAIAQRLDHLDQVVAHATNGLMAEFQGVDWNTLRLTDPGEYSARLADFQARKAELDGLGTRSKQEREQLQAKEQEQRNASLKQEWDRLPDLIPEWKDRALADKEKGEINAWALNAGFEQAAINSISSAAAIVTMRKAMLFDRLQTSRAAVENKVRSAPKLVKAGQAQQISREQNNVRTLKNNIRSSGGKAVDVAAFLLATGKA